MNENQQICFTDSTGKELFSLPDNAYSACSMGTGIRIFFSAGSWTRPMRRLTE